MRLFLNPEPRTLNPLPQTIGWYGLTFCAPEDWSIGAIGGNRECGYLRVDDLLAPRLELKWQRATRSASLPSILDRYLNDMARHARRRRVPWQRNAEVKLLKRNAKRQAALEFAWRADRQVCGAIWRCAECGRVVIAQLTGAINENLVPLARAVLASMKDHGDLGWETWSVYGFQFEIPEQFSLARQRLLSGQLELEFASAGSFGRRSAERIMLMRWACARTLLRTESFAKLADRTLRSALRTSHLDSENDHVNNHEAVRFERRWLPMQERIRSHAARTILRKPPPAVQGYFWHCEAEDKLFVVGCHVTAEHAFLARDVAESVVCHA